MKKSVIIWVMLVGFGLSSSAQEDQLFDKANALYNDAKFEAAIEAYTSILESDKESVALYYNLGNAYYKHNQIGASIYNYEKALLLDPNDADVKNNLKFAQNATIDQIEVLPKGILQGILDGITNSLGFDSWAWLSVSFVIAFVILFMAYYTAGTTLKKRLFFVSAWSFALGILIAVFFAFRQYDVAQNRQFAIILAPKTVVKSEPNLRSEEAFTLHEGTKVAVLQEISNWKKIRLVDGKIGWIPTEDLREL